MGGALSATLYTTLPTSPGPIFTATLTLTSAQILALFTTPVVIVPAPATGFYINPMETVLRTLPGGSAYAAGGVVQLALGAAATVVIGTIAAAAVITNAADQIAASSIALWTGSEANCDAQPLVINNASGAFTTGNGTLSVTVYYTVEPT
jgi:hypothetical protein